VLRRLAQPPAEGEIVIGDVVVDPFEGVELRGLRDVGNADAPAESLAEARATCLR